jgi:lactate 2-monooxygenase
VILAPIGVQGILHADAELASARGAAKVGVPYTMSTASSRSIELVAKASGIGPRWYQMYWYVLFGSCTIRIAHVVIFPRPRDNRIVLSLLKRAQEQRFKVRYCPQTLNLYIYAPV